MQKDSYSSCIFVLGPIESVWFPNPLAFSSQMGTLSSLSLTWRGRGAEVECSRAGASTASTEKSCNVFISSSGFGLSLDQ